MTTTLLLAFLLATGVASAQTPAATAQAPTMQADARFSNWLGCWRLEDDLAGIGARLCITPESNGVRLRTIVGKLNGADERVTADGMTRPIVDQDCKGTESAEWSRDGLRVFRHTDVTCGSESPRKVSSIAFLSKGPSWINVQLVEGGADRTVRVQRYRRAADQTLADGTRAITLMTASTRLFAAQEVAWNVEDVIEASGKVPGEAVQAAIAETRNHEFVLNKKNLLALADAGVTAPVIDLMIGIAFPKQFIVESRGTAGISMGGGDYDPFMSSNLFGHAYANCYGSSVWGYRSYYSSMCGAYSPYAAYGYGGDGNYGGSYPYYPGGGWVVVDPSPGTAAPSVEGRVVNGRGYTQVRPRDAEPAPVRNGSNGDGSSGSYSGAGAGGVSSQGYSGGSSSGSSGSGGSSGSSGDGGRIAVPRPPGGGF